MKTRFPLYAKILGWFFLNLLVVVLVAVGLLRARFGNTTEWLLAADAKDRIQSMTQVLAAELEHTPAAFHNEVLDRYSVAYHLVLSVYENKGKLLAGKDLAPPPEVLAALNKDPANGVEPEGELGGPPELAEPPPDERPPPPPRRGPPPRPEDDNPFGSIFGPLDDQRREFSDEQLDRMRPERRRPPHELVPEAIPLDLVRSDKPAALWLMVRVPILNGERGPRRVKTTLMGRIDSLTDNALLFDIRPWLWWGVGLLLFSALFWLPLVRSLTRAISKLTRATEEIAEGNFDVQINEQRGDELGRLGHAINQLSSRLAGFVKGQKRFLGDIAHELCSPLARMEMGLGVVEQRSAPEMKERLVDVQDDLREMRELVNELLSFSKAGLRAPDAPLSAVNVHNLVEEAIEREGEGKATAETDPEIQVMGDPRLLLRAVMNLIRNAVRYAGHAGPIQVSTQQDGKDVRITVSDSGPGVPPEALPRLFDAFYRPDEARSRETGGVGLGLAIVKSCVEACGGTVTARNRDEGGFAVEMKFQAV